MACRTEELQLRKIQPSELYLSRERLESLEELDDEFEPLPIREIGDRLFFLDGHHRAFKLMKEGREKIKVYRDDDDLDWLDYLICLDWCEKEGIEEISDLEGRVITENQFQEKWIGKCEERHEKVEDDIFEHFVKITEVSEGSVKSEICENVLRSLPEYFGIEEAVKAFIEGVRDKYFLSANVGDIPVGFVFLKDHNEFTSEIYVMGLVEELHGEDIVRKLIENVEEYLSDRGKEYLTVKTLGPSRENDAPYDRTRGFYRTVGFTPLEEFKELWDEDNPCLFMVKRID